MAEPDDITEEELALAAELSDALQGHGTREGEVADLSGHAALLSATEDWTLSGAARTRGREEVLEQAELSMRRRREQDVRKHWWVWLPLPALLAVALAYGLGDQSRPESSERAAAPRLAEIATTEDAEADAVTPAERARTVTEPGFERPPGRYHAGEVPRSLLAAQAQVLEQAAEGGDSQAAREELNVEMRGYRGQLIASLEAGGM